MNLIQFLLLKASDSSIKLATILNGLHFEIDSSKLHNNDEIHVAVDDLHVVIDKLETDFGFQFSQFHSVSHSQFKNENMHRDVWFWLSYTLAAALKVSDRASISAQYGLNDNHNLNLDSNQALLKLDLNELLFAVDCLNEFFGLGYNYIPDSLNIENRKSVLNYAIKESINLGCLSELEVPIDQYPSNFMVIIDESGILKSEYDVLLSKTTPPNVIEMGMHDPKTIHQIGEALNKIKDA